MRQCDRRRGGWFAVLVWTGIAIGCAPPAEEPPAAPLEEDPAPASALAASVQVEPFGDSVRISLRVTNASEHPVELTFPTGQSFDFHVLREGREVWRWSEDQLFTQAVRHERLQPEETRSYSATWMPPAGAEGEFEVRGYLAAQEHRLEQRTTFRIP